MATLMKIEFVLFNYECKFAHLINEIGIQATKTWNKGEYIGGSLLKRKHYGWVLDVSCYDLDKGQEEIINKISPYKKKLLDVAKEYKCQMELAFALYIDRDDIPAFNLNNEIIELISEFKGEIDVDIYIKG